MIYCLDNYISKYWLIKNILVSACVLYEIFFVAIGAKFLVSVFFWTMKFNGKL